MLHGFAPLTQDRQNVERASVIDAEQNLLGRQIDVIPITWSFGRSHDSWWGPNWEFQFDDGSGTAARRADLEATFGGTGRRLAMMYSISEAGTENRYDAAANGDPAIVDGWRSMAEDLVSLGMEDTFIRPNPEHTQPSWSPRYPRDANGNKLSQSEAGQVYADAFARCVGVMNSVSGANFDFLFSPAGRLGNSGEIAEASFPTQSSLWPAGEDPPIMCFSYYDSEHNGGPTDEEWATMTDAQKQAAAQQLWESADRPHVHEYTQLARDFGADVGMVEWGVHTAGGELGRGDNPWFIDLMMDYMVEQDFVFETVWSYYHAHGANSVFWPPELSDLPESREEWKVNVLADSGGVPEPPTIGGYAQPAQGTQDWHEPLNGNFAAIETDLLTMADFYGVSLSVSLNQPAEGSTDWHVPLNENFAAIGDAVQQLASVAGVSVQADYAQPAEGTADWHVPLNENFDLIEQDLQTLAAEGG